MSRNQQPTWRRALPWVLLVIGGLWLMQAGLKGLWDINDFDVFHLSAQWAGEEDPDLYWNDTREERHFVYPPTAAFLMIPLGWLPYHAAGILFLAIRFAALAITFVVCIRWCEEEGWISPEASRLWIVAGGLLICWRFTRNDFGNGQINLILVGLSLIGLRLSFSDRGNLPAFGGVLIAVATAMKATPLLILGVLLLHRRWHALAGAIAGFTVILYTTGMWFGTDLHAAYWFDWEIRTDRFFRATAGRDYAISLPEIIGTGAEWFGVYTNAGIMRQWFRIEAAVLCVVYLGVRLFRSRARWGVTPLWDSVFILLGTVLISPMARKAHLVGALPAVICLLALWLSWRSKPEPRIERWLFLAGSALLLISDSLPTEILIPGYEVNFSLFLALSCVALTLCFVRLAPPPKPSAGTIPTQAG